MGKIINYIRVSTIDQNPDRQRAALPDADKVFIERASGSSIKRPKLQEMLNYIRPGEGDQVHVHSIDRLARNVEDLNKIVRQIVELKAIVTFHKEGLTFGNGESSAMTDFMLNMLGSIAQFERAMIKERQAEGIAAAKAKGKHLGRPPKITPQQKEDEDI